MPECLTKIEVAEVPWLSLSLSTDYAKQGVVVVSPPTCLRAHGAPGYK